MVSLVPDDLVVGVDPVHVSLQHPGTRLFQDLHLSLDVIDQLAERSVQFIYPY